MKIRHIVVALAALLPAGTALAQSGYAHLTPKQIGYNENLPDRYAFLDFSVTASDWMDRVRLPSIQRHHDAMQINIVNQRPRGNYLEIKGKFAHLPDAVDSMIASPFTALAYRSNLTTSKWQLLSSAYREIDGPNEARWRIPSNGRKPATVLNLRDGQHVGEVGLPDGAQPYDAVTIRHSADWPSEVIAADTLFRGARLTLNKGDVHHYVFDPYLRTWKLVHASARSVRPQDGSNPTKAPRTDVLINRSNWNSHYASMPTIARDRDRRTLRVSPDIAGTVKYTYLRSDHINYPSQIDLKAGDEYEFVYINDGGTGSGLWHLLRHPVQHVELKDSHGGHIGASSNVLARVTTVSGPVSLSPYFREGQRVLIENTGTAATSVTAGSLSETLLPNEQISFRKIGAGHWQRETATVDVILAVATHQGEIGSRELALELMREGLKKTNEALDNSRASFRFREAGVRDIDVPSYLPTYAIPRWVADYKAAAVIGNSGADGIYFGGVADGCAGNYHSAPRRHFVVAMNLLCSTDMLREEMGRALGMKVNGMQGVPVIGSGNRLPLYPTPVRFVDDGNRAINPGQRDEVQHMNGVAEKVARYGYLR